MHAALMTGFPKQLVFVGGAPRSGTSLTHAMLCTSQKVNEITPEIGFFRGLPLTLRLGRGNWKQAGSFFPDQEAFQNAIRRATDVLVEQMWQAVGAPAILCSKDPLLTPYFPELHLLYRSEARFVVVVRDPCAVVRSRQEVHAKLSPDRPFSLDDATDAAHQYLSYYKAVLKQNFGGRLFMFRYEDVDSDKIKDGLARFIGVDDLFARPLWGDRAVAEDDAWASPKYKQAIDMAPRFDPLEPSLAQAVREICRPVAQRFGYN